MTADELVMQQLTTITPVTYVVILVRLAATLPAALGLAPTSAVFRRAE
jgi:hypothetical protein